MEKTTVVFVGLIGLSVASVVVSNFEDYTVPVLMLAALKFVGVSFYFMEIKKAHGFWKVCLLLFLLTFILMAVILRQ